MCSGVEGGRERGGEVRREVGREARMEGGREAGREGARQGWRQRRMEGGSNGGREGGRKGGKINTRCVHFAIALTISLSRDGRRGIAIWQEVNVAKIRVFRTSAGIFFSLPPSSSSSSSPSSPSSSSSGLSQRVTVFNSFSHISSESTLTTANK